MTDRRSHASRIERLLLVAILLLVGMVAGAMAKARARGEHACADRVQRGVVCVLESTYEASPPP